MQRQQLFEFQRFLPDPFMIICVLEGQLVGADNTIYMDGSVIGNMEMGADKVAGALVVKSDIATIGIFSPSILKEYTNKNDRTKTNSGSLSGVIKVTLELNQKHASRVMAYREKQLVSQLYNNTKLNDITKLSCLGKGMFGCLNKYKHNVTGIIITLNPITPLTLNSPNPEP